MSAEEPLAICENEGCPDEGYSLRQRKSRPAVVPETQNFERRKKFSNAEKCRRYREKIKKDPQSHELYKQMEKERSKFRRLKMTEDQRKHSNELARLRNAKSRNKKKEESLQLGQISNKRKSHRLDVKKEQARKERERLRLQNWRDNLTPQKRRRLNEKRMKRYYESKEQNNIKKISLPTPADIAEKEAWKKLKEKIGSGEKALALLQELLGEETLPITNQADHDVNDNVENTLPDTEDATTKQAVGPEPVKQKPSLKSVLKRIKDRRDKKSLQIKRLFVKTAEIKENFAKHLGFDRRTIKKYHNEDKLYSKQSKVAGKISEFFEDKSAHLPGMKTVSKRSMTQKKILTTTVQNLHKDFLNENPGLKVSLKTMFRYQPKHVLSCTKTPLIQCICEKCKNPELKLKTLKNATDIADMSVENILKRSLCDTVGKFHRLECLSRSCLDCGLSAVRTELFALNPNKLLTWERWEHVARDGKKKLEKIEKQGSLTDLVKEFLSELQVLALHRFNYQWQAAQYKTISDKPPLCVAVCTFDFAQNYVCFSQDQPQSSYYGMRQITLHPVVIHRACTQCSGRITQNMVFISNDLKHDPFFVHEVTRHILHHFKSLPQPTIKKLIIFSDGASSQYKAKLPFALMTDFNGQGITIDRHYFGSRHGKSACDALGGVIKTSAKHAVKTRAVKISNAEEFFKYCSDNLTRPMDGCCGSSRDFYLLSDVCRPKEKLGQTLRTVPGTQKLHCVKPVAENVIAIRNLSCFCMACLSIDNNHSLCENRSHVKEWEIVKLAAKTSTSNKNKSGTVAGKINVLRGLRDRDEFFFNLQNTLCNCASFEEFKYICSEIWDIVDQCPLNKRQVTISNIKCYIDKVALALRPACLPANQLPVLIVGDGNCVPRSLCLAFSGSDEWHRELRCRIAMELAVNSQYYLEGRCLQDSDGNGHLNQEAFVDTVTKLSNSIVSLGENGIDRKATFEAEVIKCTQPNIYMGMWQLFAAANVLKCVIVSVYPSKGWPLFHNIHNHLIRPLSRKSLDVISIMWSSNRNDMPDKHWTANHVVPLLFMSETQPLEIVEQEKNPPQHRNLWDELQLM